MIELPPIIQSSGFYLIVGIAVSTVHQWIAPMLRVRFDLFLILAWPLALWASIYYSGHRIVSSIQRKEEGEQ